VAKSFYSINGFRPVGQFFDPVKTGVSAFGDIGITCFSEQLNRLLILHKKMIETVQHATSDLIKSRKEMLTAAENSADQNSFRSMMFQFFQIMQPEIILNENSQRRVNRLNHSSGIAARVDRQVKNVICRGVILLNFISRWRKKSDHDLRFRELGSQGFQQRSALLKLPQ